MKIYFLKLKNNKKNILKKKKTWNLIYKIKKQKFRKTNLKLK